MSRNSVKRFYWLCLSDSLSDAEQITTRLVAPVDLMTKILLTTGLNGTELDLGSRLILRTSVLVENTRNSSSLSHFRPSLPTLPVAQSHLKCALVSARSGGNEKHSWSQPPLPSRRHGFWSSAGWAATSNTATSRRRGKLVRNATARVEFTLVSWGSLEERITAAKFRSTCKKNIFVKYTAITSMPDTCYFKYIYVSHSTVLLIDDLQNADKHYWRCVAPV
jgi:hypothetical protein